MSSFQGGYKNSENHSGSRTSKNEGGAVRWSEESATQSSNQGGYGGESIQQPVAGPSGNGNPNGPSGQLPPFQRVYASRRGGQNTQLPGWNGSGDSGQNIQLHGGNGNEESGQNTGFQDGNANEHRVNNYGGENSGSLGTQLFFEDRMRQIQRSDPFKGLISPEYLPNHQDPNYFYRIAPRKKK